jgi:putative ABC transport system permease protein
MTHDLRYAFRTLLRTPGFTIIAILTLALGIGANTAIFSVVNGVLLRPLGFHEPERLVQVWTVTNTEFRGSHSPADFLDLQRDNRSLSAVAGYRNGRFAITVNQGEPEELHGVHATADFFDILGVTAARGRTFTRAQDGTSGGALVVLSAKAWEQVFRSSPDAVGARVRINGEPHTIVGILPPRAEWPENSRLWVLSKKEVPPSPFSDLGEGADRDARYFEAIARLRPGITLAQAQDDVRRVGEAIQRNHPDTAGDRNIQLGPVYEQIVGDVRPALVALQTAVGLVLLIACANVSSLLIARAAGRRREIAIRSALGAKRSRLVRQLLTESLLLAAVGGFLGLLLASWLIVVLLRVVPDGVPRVAEISLDWTVASVTLISAFGTGMLFGVLPALQASRSDAGTTLKQSGDRSGVSRSSGRSVLVAAEIALTLILLTGAGLLLNSFLRLQRVDSGFRPENVTVMSLSVSQIRYPTAEAQAGVFRRLLEGLSQHPEIQIAGTGFPGPLRGSTSSARFFIEGRTDATRDDQPFAHLGAVSGGYFGAMGIPIIRGRTFTEADRGDAPGVAIVNLTFATKYWPGENAIGKRLKFDAEGPGMTVVGIAGDARQLGLAMAPPPILYLPYAVFPLPFTNVVVRSSAPDSVVASVLRAQLRAVDPQMPPGEVVSLETLLNRSVSQPRFRTMLVGAFALMALTLAAVGVYGLISYSVSQRTREIGIRMALGAQPRQVATPVLREALKLALIGMAIGIVGAYATARLLSRFLFGVGTADPLTFASVSALLLVVAFVASYIPSRRAMRVDPIVALRTD